MPNIPKPQGQADRPSIDKKTKVLSIDGYKNLDIPKPPTKLLKVREIGGMNFGVLILQTLSWIKQT